MSSSIILQADGWLAVIFILTWFELVQYSHRPWHLTVCRLHFVSFSRNWTVPGKTRNSQKIVLQTYRFKRLKELLSFTQNPLLYLACVSDNLFKNQSRHQCSTTLGLSQSLHRYWINHLIIFLKMRYINSQLWVKQKSKDVDN